MVYLIFSERYHHHIVEIGLSLLPHVSIPLTYWNYAFPTVVYLINHLPTPTLHMSSPYAKLFDSFPNYSTLCVFGYLCYPWLRPYSSHKLDTQSILCIFLGYPLTQNAYLCLDPSILIEYTPFGILDLLNISFHLPPSRVIIVV